MSGVFETIGEVMFARADLIVEQPYFERKSGQYFWTPDGIGCYWFESKLDLDASLDYSGRIMSVEELED